MSDKRTYTKRTSKKQGAPIDRSLESSRTQEETEFLLKEEREAEIYEKRVRMGYSNYYNVAHLAPPGYIYGFVREHFNDNEEASLLEDAMYRGWKPVPAKRHPELVPIDPSTMKPRSDDLIRRPGSILCERLKRVHDAENETRRYMTRDEICKMPALREFSKTYGMNPNTRVIPMGNNQPSYERNGMTYDPYSQNRNNVENVFGR
jgi:hypothetical protein